MGIITVQRALTEIKTIDARVEKKIHDLRIVEISQEGKLLSGILESEFKIKSEASLQSISDLIMRKSLLRNAINKSNTVAMVKVMGEDVTVAEAILLKDVYSFKQQVYSKMKSQLATISQKVESVNTRVRDNALNLAKNALGSDNISLTDKDVENIVKPYMKINELTIVDPIDVSGTILDLEDQVLEFFGEIDIVLSESNALTTIEV